MLDKEINLLDEIDNVSKLHTLGREDIDTIMLDFAKHIVPCLKIERLNVWLFNQERTAIISIGEYDARTDVFKRDSILQKKDFPTYFNGLEENKIIHASDIYTHELTKEFNELYSKPNDIYSLLDIPLRICGELIGVMCFEKTGAQKLFTKDEISFCLSISFVLGSNLESRHRRAAQLKLEESLAERELLIKEINHRVKNNFSILISLMHISKDRAIHKETQVTLQEYEQRIFSMLKIHDMLNKNLHYSKINISQYITELLDEFKHTYPQFTSSIKTNIQELSFLFETSKIIHIGLIISEILLDSIKYAADTTKNYVLSADLKEIDDQTLYLKIGDNGKGFNFDEESKKQTLGLPLIKDLIDSLEIKATYPTVNNAYYLFEIKF